jgi:hypothetical protein
MSQIKNSSNYLSEPYNKLTEIVLKSTLYINLVFASLTLYLVFWSLNKGLVFADESFYLLHLQQPNEVVSFSEWPFYAQLIFPNDLFQIRILIISFYLFSIGILSFSVFRFFENIKLLEIFTIGIVGMFSFYSPVQFVPNYVTFNIILITLSTGLFLLMLQTDTKKKKYLFGILTGFTFGPLIFIMITNIPFVGLMGFVILSYSKKEKISQILAIAIGIGLSIMFFFLCVRSFSNYMNDLKMAMDYLATDQSHGNSSILDWVINVIIYALKSIVPSALLFFMSIYLFKNKLLKYSFFVFALLIMLLELRANLLDDIKNINTPTQIFVILFTIILGTLFLKKYKLSIVLVFALFIPFFAALGTDVSFIIRSTAYIGISTMFVFCMIKINENRKLLVPFYLFISFILFRFLFQFPNKSGWHDYKLEEQNIPLKSIGINQDIKLDALKIERLKKLKSIIPVNSKIVVSNNTLWGNAFLLSLNPLYLSYVFDEKNTIQALNKMGNVFLIEDINAPFPNSFLKKMDSLNYIYTITNIDKEIKLYKINLKKN